MPGDTYTVTGIVLRKTKLGETDLIVTLLGADGAQVRAVAKGARKPKSSFSSRLELGSVVTVLLARGRSRNSLDIVKEARLEQGNDFLRGDFLRIAAAEPMLEFAERVSQAGLDAPVMFPLTNRALAALGQCGDRLASVVTAAYLLKALAASGLRPSLHSCASCGAPVEADGIGVSHGFDELGGPGGSEGLDGSGSWGESNLVAFSHLEGGVVCPHCRSAAAAVMVDANLVAWMRTLMSATFDQILALEADARVGFAVLEHCQRLTETHVGVRLKSLEFMVTCGMF